MKKIMSIFLCLSMILSIFVALPFSASAKEMNVASTAVSVTTKTVDEAIDWCKSKRLQNIETFDSRSTPYEFRWQCVDFVAAYYEFLGFTYVKCNGGEYGQVVQPSGMTPIQGAIPRKGDVLVYSGSTSNPAGHVAIYESDYSTYHQRWNNHNYVENITDTRYDGLSSNPYWGVIRPNFDEE